MAGCSQPPESPDARYETTVRARALFENGNPKAARKLLADLADATRNADDLTNLGLSELRLGKIQQAELHFKLATDLDPRCARAFYQMGVLRHQRAQAALLQAQESPRHAQARQSQAAALLEASSEALASAAGASAGNATVHHLLGVVCQELGRKQPSDKALAEAQRLDPNGTDAPSEAEFLSSILLPVRPAARGSSQRPVRFDSALPRVRSAGLLAARLGADKRPDLLLLRGSGRALRNDSLGVAESAHWSVLDLLPGQCIVASATAFLDGDDLPDLVVFGTEPGETVETSAATPVAAGSGKAASIVTAAWLLRGSDPLRALPIGEVPTGVRQAAAVDLDRDGDLDILVATSATPGVRVWLNEGSGRFQPAAPVRGLESLPPVRHFVATDFGADRLADLVCADDAGHLRVLVQRQPGSFVDVSSLAGLGGERARVLATADLDADGRNDLLLGNDEGLWVYVNQGGDRFLRQAAYRVPRSAWSVGRPRGVPVAGLFVADLDNDGLDDVVTLQMNGTSEFVDPTAPQIAAAVAKGGKPAKPEDASPVPPGQGNAPLQALTNARLCVWHNDGRGTLLDVTDQTRVEPELLFPEAPAVADFDQDGDLDLAVTRSDSTVEVLWNDGGNTNTRIEVWLDAIGSTSGENDAIPNSPVACIGARLQLYAGTYAHGCEVRDQPLRLGLGQRKKLDVVRITWPDGQVQNALDVRVPANHRLLFRRETRGS